MVSSTRLWISYFKLASLNTSTRTSLSINVSPRAILHVLQKQLHNKVSDVNIIMSVQDQFMWHSRFPGVKIRKVCGVRHFWNGGLGCPEVKVGSRDGCPEMLFLPGPFIYLGSKLNRWEFPKLHYWAN